MTAWMTGEEASAASGQSITEIDAAVAAGVIPAEYHGWQLMVAKPATEAAAPRRRKGRPVRP